MPPQQQHAQILKLHGRTGDTDSGGRPIKTPPAFARKPPRPPTWLSKEAAAEWRRIVPGLQRLDLLKEEDRATLTAYCETWATFVEATRLVRKEGLTIEAKQGRLAHPAVGIARNAGRELRAFANLYGLSPASEMALGKAAAGDEGENPFAGD